MSHHQAAHRASNVHTLSHIRYLKVPTRYITSYRSTAVLYHVDTTTVRDFRHFSMYFAGASFAKDAQTDRSVPGNHRVGTTPG